MAEIGRLRRVWLRATAEPRKRFRDDLRLAIICLGGFLAAVFILPFALYRWSQGDLVMAALDAAICVCVFSTSAYTWRTGRTEGSGLFLVLASAAGCIIVASMLGLTGALWSYAVMVMNFFLLTRRAALLASLALIGAVAAQAGIAATPIDMFTYAVSGVLVCIYSSVFASRTLSQRRRLEELVVQDALTGAGNRRRMEIDLKAAVAAWKPGRPSSAVVILDLDHFKLVNDRYGHEAGDRVLIDFARIVRDGLRRDDRLYRYGGEEFVLLLTGLSSSALITVLTKLRSRIKQNLAGPGGPVTASIGVSMLCEGDHWTGWLSRADGALYAAKREGRDRIVIDGIPGSITELAEVEG